MLAVSPLRSKDEREEENDRFSIGGDEFSCGSLLDSIDFDDIFIGLGDGDVLPDLEIDSDLLAEFSVSTGGEESEKAEQENHRSGGSSGSGSISTNSNLNYSSGTHQGEEIASQRDDFEDSESVKANNSVEKEGRTDDVRKGRKSASQKRKVKVDWTPELHRRFVQAVEQLGMDKAVPSRILELMGIDCLTRHNIASHLQKYRSHQKHLRAREAEAASWNQRRQIYSGGTGTTMKMMRSISGHQQQQQHHHMMMSNNQWIAPTVGFPPQPFTARPLHVWGHPTLDHQPLMMHIWPKHLPHHHSPPPPPWAPPSPAALPSLPHPPADLSYWHFHHQRVPNNALTPGTPCFPQTLAPRFPGPPVPGILPHGMYEVDHQQQQSIGVPSAGPSDLHPPFDHFHPSKESIDAAIGDVLSKPWLPLPLGLKPPSLDSVLVELQRQGVPKIPPTTTATL